MGDAILQGAVRLAIELHKDQVPDLQHIRVVLVHKVR